MERGGTTGKLHDNCLHSQRELACQHARQHEHSTIRTLWVMGTLKSTLVVLVAEACLLKMGQMRFANGSVRPALFPGTKQPSACGQLEGRLGTQNDRGHSASPFILPWDPMGPPRSWRPSLPSAARPFEPVQEFQGLSGPYITFTALFPLLILPSSGGKNVVSQFAQTTNSVVKTVNNERERGSVGVHSKTTGAKTEKKIQKEKS